MQFPTHNDLELVKDWIVIIGFPLTALGTFLAARQYRRGVVWNQLNATFSLFGNKQYSEYQAAASRELVRLGIEFHKKTTPLSDTECDQIIADAVAYGAVGSLLNFLEDYSTALHAGVVHKPIAFNLMGSALTHHYKILEPLVLKRRKSRGSDDLWSQFELAAKIFRDKFVDIEQEKSRKELKALKSNGAKTVY